MGIAAKAAFLGDLEGLLVIKPNCLHCDVMGMQSTVVLLRITVSIDQLHSYTHL